MLLALHFSTGQARCSVGTLWTPWQLVSAGGRLARLQTLQVLRKHAYLVTLQGRSYIVSELIVEGVVHLVCPDYSLKPQAFPEAT